MRPKYFLPVVITFILFSLSSFSQKRELWGMTVNGGKYSGGVIFKTDSLGANPVEVYSFYKNDGKFPKEGMIMATNGKFYGMTSEGGKYNKGVIYEYDTLTTNYTKLYEFDFVNGSKPWGKLLQASNGKLYGLTTEGGNTNVMGYPSAYGCGVLFEFDIINNSFLKLKEFNDTLGINPYGSIVEATNGKLYALTSDRGMSNGIMKMGTLVEYDIASNQLIVKEYFDLSKSYYYPSGNIIQATNGKLYGTTDTGGLHQKGVVFEYNIVTDTMIKIVDFDSLTGNIKSKSLLQANDGKLYGTCAIGGLSNSGTLFVCDIDSLTINVLHSFSNNSISHPKGDLIQTTNGNLYGYCLGGGIYSRSSIFEYNIGLDTVIVKAYSKSYKQANNFMGALFQSSNGKLYGIGGGGNGSYGSLFEYSLGTDTIIKLLDFDMGDQGIFPYGSLLYASNGKFYGLTSNVELGNHFHGNGVLFEFDPSNYKYTVIFTFYGLGYGKNPYGSLIELSNGKLYGMTSRGGLNWQGTIFEYDINSKSFSTAYHFNSGSGGNTPRGSLMLASNGKLYGMTNLGGLYNKGVLFEFDPTTSQYVKKIDFNGVNNGANPEGSLVEDSNATLYGLTGYGGQNNDGVLFSYNLTNQLISKKIDFDFSTIGTNPTGDLLIAQNGKMYGTVSTNDHASVFKYDPVNDSIRRIQYNDNANTPNYANGSLIQTSSGKLYGLIYFGYSSYGGIFELDPAIDSTKHTAVFSYSNGANPYYSNLTEVFICSPTFDTIAVTSCKSYISPSGKIFTISGSYNDTISNMCGADSIITISLIIDTVDVSVSVLANSATLHANQNTATYQWFDCINNSKIIGATTQNYTAINNGSYSVIIQNNQCIDTSNCVAINNVGFDDMYSEIFSVFPNPTKDYLIFKFGLSINKFSKLFIYNSLGMKVKQFVLPMGKVELKVDVSEIETGLYFYKLVSESEMIGRGSFIKE